MSPFWITTIRKNDVIFVFNLALPSIAACSECRHVFLSFFSGKKYCLESICEMRLNHLGCCSSRCGPIPKKHNTSPRRIQLRLLFDTLLMLIWRMPPGLCWSRCHIALATWIPLHTTYPPFPWVLICSHCQAWQGVTRRCHNSVFLYGYTHYKGNGMHPDDDSGESSSYCLWFVVQWGGCQLGYSRFQLWGWREWRWEQRCQEPGIHVQDEVVWLCWFSHTGWP